MKPYPVKKAVKVSAFLLISLAASSAVYVLAQGSNAPEQVRSSSGKIEGINGIQDMETIFKYINFYRTNHNGNYPSATSDILEEISRLPEIKSKQDYDKAKEALLNPDSIFADDEYQRSNPNKSSPYTITNLRPDGRFVGTPKPAGSQDVLAYTDLYLHKVQENRAAPIGLSGFYLVLYDDSSVAKVPYDEVSYTRVEGGSIVTFPNQAGIPWDALSFEEFWLPLNSSIPFAKSPSVGVDVDSGGFESLVQLSRFEKSPDSYGIERKNLQNSLGNTLNTLNLPDLQATAKKLGLDTQVEKQTLTQLQKSGAPALLFLQDDGRIVTLTALDDDRAVVIDRGLTQNVERSVLEKRYGGEALVPTKALTQNAAIVADDAVRELLLPSLDAEVPQQFVLRNTGATPITLQLEYPLLGVTESKLSQDTIAPGETATLDIKVKWRSILKAPTQNVLVSIQTNDPIVPRLQLAILLTPPATAGQ